MADSKKMANMLMSLVNKAQIDHTGNTLHLKPLKPQKPTKNTLEMTKKSLKTSKWTKWHAQPKPDNSIKTF